MRCSFLLLLLISARRLLGCGDNPTDSSPRLDTSQRAEASREWGFIVVEDTEWSFLSYDPLDDGRLVVTGFYRFTVANRYAKDSFPLRFRLRFIDHEGHERAVRNVNVATIPGTSQRRFAAPFSIEVDNLEQANHITRMSVELL